ncbi:hypothetical protein HYS72_01040 [Candidatus Pacearchaeota archaeon]|nr:hypothetical protein [Candidatus Pacearchaeota archaeon]MBI2057069.1 hypothetical protein [Candidatus Pacearchaeota archaeon]
MKKQIVFIEYFPTIHGYKVAKGLRKSGRYETVLISFNKVDRKFFGTGYDKIINLEVSQKINFKNLFFFIRKMFSKEWSKFFAEIKSLNPYIVQVNNLDLLTRLSLFLIDAKVPKIYYAYDILAFYRKKFSMRENFLKKIEKYYFKKMDGILHKGPREELTLLDYPVNVPDLALLPGCLEDWTYVPKKKNMKEIHLAVAGPPLESDYYINPFKNIIREITFQKIHLHIYGKSLLNNKYFLKEEKNNSYFHYHDKVSPDELNKEISNYHYGLVSDFFNKLINPLWLKTSIGNKMYNYLEAGLPIIMTNDLQAMADIVKKHKIGICIDYKDIKELKNILKGIDYEKLQKNIKVAQKELNISNLIKDLESFYEKVAEIKTKYR